MLSQSRETATEPRTRVPYFQGACSSKKYGKDGAKGPHHATTDKSKGALLNMSDEAMRLS